MHHQSCRTSHELLSCQQLKYLLSSRNLFFLFWIRQIMKKSEICPWITRTLLWQQKYWTIPKPSRDGVKKHWGKSVLAVLVCSGAVPIQKVLPFGVDKVYCKICLYLSKHVLERMESCKADVQRLSLLIKAALRNITNYPKEQKGGAAQLKGEIPAGRLGSALLLVLLYYNLMLLQIKVSFPFLVKNRK